MTGMQLLVLKEAEADLQRGKSFYDANQSGVGDYFFDSLLADIESLSLYAGIHGKQFGITGCWLNVLLRSHRGAYYRAGHSGFKAQSILDS